MLYLDNSATTKPHPQVIEVIKNALENHFGNPSSLHKKGLEAERLLNRSREVVAAALNVENQEIVFTSGGTEGDNLAIKGIALGYQNRGKHIITTKIEHPAITESCIQLENLGFQITYLDVDQWGLVNPQDIEKSITDETILVSIIHVNNEVGTIQPLAEIGKILKEYPQIFFHVDAVQSFAKVPLKLKEWSIDLATISGHKIHGPKGVGALYIKKNITPWPILSGGGQENNLRSGTENIPVIAGFAKSCRIAREIFVEDMKQMKEIKQRCVSLIKERMPFVEVNGPEDVGASPYILNISIPGLRGEVLVHALEEEGIYVSTGSACSSKKDIVSPVLSAMGKERATMLGSIRISFTYGTKKQQVEYLIDRLVKVAQNLGRG